MDIFFVYIYILANGNDIHLILKHYSLFCNRKYSLLSTLFSSLRFEISNQQQNLFENSSLLTH